MLWTISRRRGSGESGMGMGEGHTLLSYMEFLGEAFREGDLVLRGDWEALR